MFIFTCNLVISKIEDLGSSLLNPILLITPKNSINQSNTIKDASSSKYVISNVEVLEIFLNAHTLEKSRES